jgi:hypothetical protein
MDVVRSKRYSVERNLHAVLENGSTVSPLSLVDRHVEQTDIPGDDGFAPKLKHENADNYNSIQDEQSCRFSYWMVTHFA